MITARESTGGSRPARSRRSFAGTDPVVHQIADIGHGVPEGAQLPVEDSEHSTFTGDHVSHAVVTVDDRGSDLFRHAFFEDAMDVLHRGKLAGLRLLPLLRPAAKLSRDVVGLLAEFAEADLVGIKRVKGSEHLDDVIAEHFSLGHGYLGGEFLVVKHRSFDEVHDIERSPVDGPFMLDTDRARHRYVAAMHRRDDRMLSTHVVGRRQDLACRGTAKHVGRTSGIVDLERQVRVTTRDQRKPQWRDHARNVQLEPSRQSLSIDACRCLPHCALASFPDSQRPYPSPISSWSMTEPPQFSIDLTGQTILITGATSGLGKRFAEVLALSGATVAISGRRVDRLEALAAEINSAGGVCAPVPIDMTDTDSILAAVETASEALGTITGLVNNAGIPDAQRAHKMSIELIDKVFDTNLRGPWVLSCEVARRMIDADIGGRMVNISSVAARNYGGNGAALYSTTKAGVIRMTEVLAVEWARFGINVNAIAPGAFHSEMMDGMLERMGDISGMFPRGRLGNPSQLDSTLLFFMSPSSEFVTGSVIIADDGQSPR